MWSHPAPPLYLYWKPLSLNPFSCQTPFTHLSHHWSSSVSSLSAPLFRTPRGKSPVWINPTKSPLNLSLLPAAGPGKRSNGKHRINTVWGETFVEEFGLYVSLRIVSAFFAYSSPAGTLAPGESCRIPLSQFVRNSALRHSNAISVPSTPELHVRPQYTQSFRYAETSATLLKLQP